MFRYVKSESTRCRSTYHFQLHTYWLTDIKEISQTHMLPKHVCVCERMCGVYHQTLYGCSVCFVCCLFGASVLNQSSASCLACVRVCVCFCLSYTYIFIYLFYCCHYYFVCDSICVCVWCVYVYARVFHFISALFVRPVTAKHMCSIDMRFNNTVSWFLSSSSFFSLHSDVVVVLKVVCVCISYGTEICVRFQVCSKHTGVIVRASKKWHDRTNERMSGISVA